VVGIGSSNKFRSVATDELISSAQLVDLLRRAAARTVGLFNRQVSCILIHHRSNQFVNRPQPRRNPMPFVRVVGAQGGLADLQGQLVLGAGGGEVSEVLEHASEDAAQDPDLEVVGAQGGLVDVQGPFVLHGAVGRPYLVPDPGST
jgi:hypothetical protein